MPNVKLKNYLHLHFLVFIAGFTAILGELITITAIPLVWYRMVIALALMYLYIKIKGIRIKIGFKFMLRFSLAGVIIALHWITFFGAIDEANVSIALSMFSTGAFFASIIEPLIYRRKVIWYEMLFGILVIIGVAIITQSEMKYLTGIVLGIVSAFLSSLFAVINGKFQEQHSATTISFYEFIGGIIFITIFIELSRGGFSKEFFILSTSDYGYLFILASVCTAYAFIAAVYVMRYISPYSVVLTYNLEPIYGILLALLLFPEKEKMSHQFYIGAILIITTVLLNGIIKNSGALKRKATN
ncbi:MAG: DMT family transporter [Flavobacteriaceae bacterium]|nr:DMT family transporter [Bacteroidia bacterium]NND09826.1 DMT family transporter [Flavobacteriaceae bacterium]NNL59716.1 DMT family transporter [Flavobacteriaceae bacterium]RZV67035.1 MAG: DMT family transporter [Flavobacteriaceae bacterium]